MIAALSARLAGEGLLLRGGFHPTPQDAVPRLGDGRGVATLLLVGNAGPEMWTRFAASPERALPQDPLDRWTRRVIGAIAGAFGAEAWFPFGGPPHLPFQRWALRADDVHVSPLKLLIHPEYGLWHAYRATLAFASQIELPQHRRSASPCESCAARPCLAACPVDAYTASGFAADRCIDHLADESGAGCRESGCRARRACPVGGGYRQTTAQLRFHMDAFRANAAARRGSR